MFLCDRFAFIHKSPPDSGLLCTDKMKSRLGRPSQAQMSAAALPPPPSSWRSAATVQERHLARQSPRRVLPPAATRSCQTSCTACQCPPNPTLMASWTSNQHPSSTWAKSSWPTGQLGQKRARQWRTVPAAVRRAGRGSFGFLQIFCFTLSWIKTFNSFRNWSSHLVLFEICFNSLPL